MSERARARAHGRCPVRTRLGTGVLALAWLAAAGAGAAAAQDTPVATDPACGFVGARLAPIYLDRLRLQELGGRREATPFHVTRSGTRTLVCHSPGAGLSRPPTFELLPAAAQSQFNSEYPREINNGLRWAGRGISFDASAGARLSWSVLSAAFAPVFSYQQNDGYEILPVTLPGTSSFAWFWRPTGIDWPQRFGSDPFWWSSPGESYVRADAFGLAAGFSTETLRWGPVRRWPLLMSGTAAGFPHAFLGTSGPAEVGIGRLSVELIWGHLAESDYFDLESGNDSRLFAGFVAAFEPTLLPGLSFGFARAYLETIPADGLSLIDYIRRPYTNLFTNRDVSGGEAFASDNELFAFFARWVFPRSGAEIYAEFARDDHWANTDDLLQEPEHAGALAIGFQKLSDIGGDRRLRVAGEIVTLNASETQRSRRNEVIFYTHSGIRQGYTHRGQLLGAAVGPSGDGQYLAADLLTPRWSAGLYVERVRYANDIYWQNLAQRYTYLGHDVELTGGLRGSLLGPAPGLELIAELAWSGRYNRGWVDQVGPYELSFDHNLSLQLGAAWHPGGVQPWP